MNAITGATIELTDAGQLFSPFRPETTRYFRVTQGKGARVDGVAVVDVSTHKVTRHDVETGRDSVNHYPAVHVQFGATLNDKHGHTLYPVDHSPFTVNGKSYEHERVTVKWTPLDQSGEYIRDHADEYPRHTLNGTVGALDASLEWSSLSTAARATVQRVAVAIAAEYLTDDMVHAYRVHGATADVESTARKLAEAEAEHTDAVNRLADLNRPQEWQKWTGATFGTSADGRPTIVPAHRID